MRSPARRRRSSDGGWGADTVHLPDTPRGGLGTAYLTALHTYLNSTNSELQGGAA
ncbi:hypothetical protein ACFZDJ_19575 [Streptomyces sp. NPDC007896]|uniref:hypothetical protein n=1 Tax=Streptomyces sp. NPDC007896 TaxID=3364784 RepID=UPI0036E623C0